MKMLMKLMPVIAAIIAAATTLYYLHRPDVSVTAPRALTGLTEGSDIRLCCGCDFDFLDVGVFLSREEQAATLSINCGISVTATTGSTLSEVANVNVFDVDIEAGVNSQGKALLIQDASLPQLIPAANHCGGCLIFTFETPLFPVSVGVVDIDFGDEKMIVESYSSDGVLLGSYHQSLEGRDENGYWIADVESSLRPGALVSAMRICAKGKFAMTFVEACHIIPAFDFPSNVPTPPSTVVPTVPDNLISSNTPSFWPTTSPWSTAPSAASSTVLTQEPTLGPSAGPTAEAVPSRSLSTFPSQETTVGPTEGETDSPSLVPTTSPTQGPTEEPTQRYTLHPSTGPSLVHSASPTQPTREVSTVSPTKGSTDEPTQMPTMFPSQAPEAFISTSAPVLDLVILSTNPSPRHAGIPSIQPSEGTTVPSSVSSTSPTVGLVTSKSTPGPTPHLSEAATAVMCKSSGQGKGKGKAKRESKSKSKSTSNSKSKSKSKRKRSSKGGKGSKKKRSGSNHGGKGMSRRLHGSGSTSCDDGGKGHSKGKGKGGCKSGSCDCGGKGKGRSSSCECHGKKKRCRD